MALPFVPEGFEAPAELALPGMRLEPLGPEHNERDHEAWSSSIDHIRATPGFRESNWPRPMSLEENLDDLQRHAADFAARRGFTYSVLDPDTDEVIGCVYIYPSKDEDHDARVESWVRASRADLDTVLWRAVSDWLDADWPFSRADYRGGSDLR
jgi:RimJ/RimL family protein N-acetyltransferase